MNRLKTLFSTLIILGLMITHSYSQEVPEQYRKPIDSLNRLLANQAKDSNKVKSLMDLLNLYIDFDLEKARLFGLQANELSKEINYRFGIGRSYYSLGMITTNQAAYKMADSFFNLSEPIFRDLNREDRVAMIQNGRGNLAYMQGNYWLAGNYYSKSAELYEKLEDTINLTTAYQNLIAVLGETHNYDRAVELARKSLDICAIIKDSIQAAYAFEGLLVNYTNMGKLDEAAKQIDTLLKVAESTVDFNIATEIYNAVGNYYHQKKDWANAKKFYEKALTKAKQLGSNFLEPLIHKSLGALLIDLGDHVAARQSLEKAMQMGEATGNQRAIYETSFQLSKLYKQLNNPATANKYLERHLQLKDSILNADTRNHAAYLEASFESVRKEKEIDQLKIQNAEKELAVVKKNRWMIAGGITALSLLFIVGLLYRSSKQKQLLAEKDKEVQQQQIQFLEKQQQIVSMQSMINGQESERTRIAKDLHDGLGGLFSTVKMYFSTLQNEVGGLDKNELFSKTVDLLGTASTEVRRIAHNMMPEVLMKLGLVNAVNDLCNHVSAGKLLAVKFEVHGMNGRLNPSTEIMLYRIVQELLNNIIKHAEASEAIIQFIRDENRLSIIIEDNGRGFNSLDVENQKKAGIETVKSRVNFLNGKLTIDSQSGIGTTVMMDFLINDASTNS